MDNEIRCIKCGCNQIVADKKGFGLVKSLAGFALVGPVGLLGGLIGSKKTVITCLKCGNKWKV